MTERNKFLALLFLGLAVIAILLLSVSLPNLDLNQGKIFSPNQAQNQTPSGELAPMGNLFLLILQAIVAILLLLSLIFLLFSREGRDRLLINLIIAIFLALLLSYLMGRPKPAEPIQPTPNLPSEVAPQSLQITPEPVPPLPESSNPALLWATLVGLALLISAGTAGLLWYFRRKMDSAEPFDRLAKEAERAAAELQQGGDLKDIVIRCYFQMGRILREERGLERKSAMTPREFEQLLSRMGVPEEPVYHLTRLFEHVRYGRKPAGEQEQQRAIESLKAIAAYCKGWREAQQV